ncbi:ShlB/FhaC/HecB family hemolysin secretion/activation protein [uncultured Zoogloea sp.]|jgi:hemolysin activation/secretion protein|uniref:ShlB/FhaC/HecB family hemolysin secretion/activation protein n=1 Tax=uncultured Zoogloea sp. TaxID=160237 RepID=UPI0026290892|nr:ShlB/FhaC/HecB family hemolysin secretion/activation protein [uncultured Zoogloea sp.]
MQDSFQSRVSVVLTFFTASVGSALAQQDAGQILRQIEPPSQPTSRPPAELIDQRLVPRKEISDVPDLKVDVTAFRLIGAPEEERTAIMALLASAIGPNKSFQDILDAASLVRSHLNARGYLLAQVYIPEQKLQDGVVEIVILLGMLGKVELNYDPATPVSKARIQAQLDRLQTGVVLRTAELERVLFLLNDLHGVRARSTIRPGSTPGTADLIVDVTPDPTVGGLFQLDAMGSRYTGLYRAMGGLNIGSPLGIGDSLSFRGIYGEDSGINFGSVSYVAPVGTDGWRLGGSYSNLNYKLLTKAGIPPGTGAASDGLVFALYPLVRSRNVNVFVQAGFDHKEFTDVPDAGAVVKRRSDSALVTVSGDLRDTFLGGGINSFSLGYTHGSLDNPTAQIGTPTGLYRRINPYYSRLQSLGQTGLLAFFRYSGQLTPDRLDSSEKFSLGGPSGVRAFPVGEAPADRAHLVSVELRHTLPNWDGRIPGSLVGAMFWDWGRARLDRDPSAGNSTADRNTRVLSAVGLALNWATAQSWSAQASLAWRTQGELVSDKLDHRPRLYAQITRYF